MMKFLRLTGLALLVILIAVQFIPVDKNNPPERSTAAAPAEVQVLLRRACFDCHSNETVWPWYSQIAPASLLIARDVKNGRKEVNFSTWETFDEKRKARKLKEIAKEVEKGDMPPFYYLPLHPDAKLSPAERDVIVNWAKQG
jgi:heme-binding protein